jgi:hypothetical protein
MARESADERHSSDLPQLVQAPRSPGLGLSISLEASMRHSILFPLLISFVGLAVLAQSQPASPVDVMFRSATVEWSPEVAAELSTLTVSGPNGLYLKQEYPSGAQPVFSALDEEGAPRPEGTYRWELIVALPGKSGAITRTISGAFAIQGGRIVSLPDDEAPVVVDSEAPTNSLLLDREGRLGLGTTVPASQLHLKGAEPALTLEDTTSGGRAFTLRALEDGDGSLGLFDQAGKASWLVDAEGRVGINTTKPTSTLTVDGYIESTKGFLVSGRPVGGFRLPGGGPSLYTEGASNSFFGTNSGNGTMTGLYNSFFGVDTGSATTSGSGNTSAGWGAGSANASGNDNSIFGAGAGRYNTASNNSFFGQNAGNQNTSGTGNSFFGKSAGEMNVASDNAFFGYSAGKSVSGGNYNSFFGSEAGYGSVNGYHNCFFGYTAGYSNNWGNWNAFFGYRAGYANTSGWNSFFGANAGEDNTEGHGNSFLGYWSGMNNTIGSFNTFLGSDTGYVSTVEEGNTLLGAKASFDPGPSPGTDPVTNSTAIGYHAYVTQSNSLVLGSIAGVNNATNNVNVGIGTTSPAYALDVRRTGANSVVIATRTDGASNYMNATTTYANFGSANNYPLRLMVNGTWRLRLDLNNSLSMVNGATCTAGGVWVNASSRDYKENILDLSPEQAVETLEGLNPVTYNYKADDEEAHVGFIAEDVPELVATKDRKGLSPMDIVAVLTKVVQEQQKTIQEERSRNEEQQRTIEEQREAFRSLRAEIETLKTLLRR